ncbi:MAG: L,D-transpeptidase family protein [Stappiaceae bacterium]
MMWFWGRYGRSGRSITIGSAVSNAPNSGLKPSLKRIGLTAVLGFGIFAQPALAVFSNDQHARLGHGLASSSGPVRNVEHFDRVAMGSALRILANQKTILKAFARKSENATVLQFYEEREWQPAWIEGGTFNLRARAIIDKISRAEEEGLDPEDYSLPDGSFGEAIGMSPIAIAEAEMRLSVAVLRYVIHLQTGRVDPRKISRLITSKPQKPDTIAALNSLALTANPVAVLESFSPPHPGYLKLKMLLAKLRLSNLPVEPMEPIASGKSLKLGMSGPRVAHLRKRLKIAAANVGDTIKYDEALFSAVKSFQESADLTVDGIAGAKTIARLNATIPGDPIADVIANMERWRWLPRDLGSYHVHVNIPEFTVRIMDDGAISHQTRVVVGKPANQTPIFSDEMEYIVVNPYWNVPRSIATKELLPKIRANPSRFMRAKGYQVVSRGRVVHPRSINWRGVNMRSIRIRQKPGARNALGQVKFMFPNKHAVYLHDTPSKSLFNKTVRAFSHGCVRVLNPMEFADALLSMETKLNGKRLRKAIGGKQKHYNLSDHIPVHLTYFTVAVNDDGDMQRFGDIYGHHRKLLDALNL